MSSNPITVLVVDNDPAVRRSLRVALLAQGYSVREARTGEEAVEEASLRAADLILLDIEMPGTGGMEACRRLRSLTPQTGIIMVSVCDSEELKVKALEEGADDYITKPFSLRELGARLRAITRRLGPLSAARAILQIGELELDVERRSLRRAGVELHLSPIEFSLVSYLMQHANIPVEHGKLLRAIWGPEYGCELEYLRTYIKRLRKKIERDAAQPEYLVTVPWLGYRFQDPAQVMEAAAAS
jgi:two-component system KDP operon response regulator KdpE